MRYVLPADFPGWIRSASVFWNRNPPSPGHETSAATGNACYPAAVLRRRDEPFDPSFGQTGGEDTEFARFLDREGVRGRWVAEAVVVEVADARRKRWRWHMGRHFRLGLGDSAIRRKYSGWLPAACFQIPKALAGTVLATSVYLSEMRRGRAALLKMVTAWFRHAGRIAYFLGVRATAYHQGTDHEARPDDPSA